MKHKYLGKSKLLPCDKLQVSALSKRPLHVRRAA